MPTGGTKCNGFYGLFVLEQVNHVLAAMLGVANESLLDGIYDEVEAFERDLADEC